MKRCPKCFSEYSDDGITVWRKTGMWICSKCDPEKLSRENPNITKKSLNPFYKKNFDVCNKGCGTEIYFDPDHKSENGKWIPLDRHTRSPHNCSKTWNVEGGPGGDIMKYTGKTKETTSTPLTGDKPEPKKEKQIGIPETLWYDLNEIPSDPIIDEIKDGQKEKKLAILYYEHDKQLSPPLQPLDELSSTLDPKILQGLRKYGFENGLLTFQDDSIKAILSGKNTIISAPTGSGKTEAFIIPIIQKICKENYPRGVFVLLIYPLRALARDQVKKINSLIEDCELGDKIQAFSILGRQGSSVAAIADYNKYINSCYEITHRKSVIVATNFDFINTHLTLVDNKWNNLCKPAKVVVMDELHSYTSFHGSSVYHIIKRMKGHMKDVQFIGSSATLHNAQGFFENICDLAPLSSRPIESKFGRERSVHKFFMVPLKFPQQVLMQEIAKICYKKQSDPEVPDKKSRQLVFSNTHNNAEFLAEEIEKTSNMKINVHRGGLKQEDRTQTEIMLSDGEIDGISCTPTLELGIDIGTVDVAISAFTHNHDTFTQRSGRAGREGKKSYTFCVFNPNDASCHYYSRNMLEYINQIHEIQINKKNPIISVKHEEATKIEKECESDRLWWQDHCSICGRGMMLSKHLLKHSDSTDICHEGKIVENPKKKRFFEFQDTMSMRGSAGKVNISHNGKYLGDREIPVGYYQLHKKALYHRDKLVYEVESFRKTPTGGTVNLKKSEEKNKVTRPIVNVLLTKQLVGEKYGKIELYRNITGYYKGDYNLPIEEWEKHDGSEEGDWEDLGWSSTHMAVKIELPSKFIPDVNLIGKEDPGIHTIIHVIANAAKIVAKCEATDVDVHYHNGSIYLYDNTNEGANGVSQIISENYEKIMETSRKLLGDCDCDKRQNPELGGCPRCTFTTGFCSTHNKELDKKKAREFFGVL